MRVGQADRVERVVVGLPILAARALGANHGILGLMPRALEQALDVDNRNERE